MKNRNTRLAEIIDIISHQVISSQEELSKQLAIRGHIVTQATLSRDLKNIKATKIATDKGQYRYIVGESSTLHRGSRRGRQYVSGPQHLQHSSVVSASITGNLVVVKTRNGYASGLAYDIDTLDSPLIAGTISGADTVFAALAEDAPRADVIELFRALLPPHTHPNLK